MGSLVSMAGPYVVSCEAVHCMMAKCPLQAKGDFLRGWLCGLGQHEAGVGLLVDRLLSSISSSPYCFFSMGSLENYLNVI